MTVGEQLAQVPPIIGDHVLITDVFGVTHRVRVSSVWPVVPLRYVLLALCSKIPIGFASQQPVGHVVTCEECLCALQSS